MNSEQPTIELVLPKQHLEIALVDAGETYLLGSRGSFKTSRGIALFNVRRVYEMPRSSGVAVGLSYEHLGDNTLPPLMAALEEFGFSHGDHFVVGQAPPKHWPRPYLGNANNKWDHTMCWHNGTCVHLISLKKKASANGVSAQWGFFDEAKFMDESTLTDEIFPIFRGNEKHFQHCGGYLSKFFATDKLADPAQIKWLLNKRKQNDQERINIIITLQLQLNKLKTAYDGGGITQKQKLKPQIHAVESRLAKLRSGMVHYVEVSAYDVLPLLGEKWLKDKRRNMRDHDFAVAIENKDPDRPGDAFYPAFNESLHTYEIMHDIDPMRPFIIAPDYQHSVSPISVAQLSKLPGAEDVSLNYVDEVYTLGNASASDLQPNGNGAVGGLSEAVRLFCERNKSHIKKVVYYIYDATAVGKRNDADTYYQLVKRELRRNKWACIDVYTSTPPLHFLKYQNTKDWMMEKVAGIPAIRINRVRCPKLIISINGAPAISKNGKTEKDKKAEQVDTMDQSETTHFSDTFDMINHAVIALKRIKGSSPGMGVAAR